MNRHEQRQAAFKQVSAVRQVLTTMPKADTTKKTFMEHILGTPNSRYEKAKNNFLEKLNRVSKSNLVFIIALKSILFLSGNSLNFSLFLSSAIYLT